MTARKALGLLWAAFALGLYALGTLIDVLVRYVRQRCPECGAKPASGPDACGECERMRTAGQQW